MSIITADAAEDLNNFSFSQSLASAFDCRGVNKNMAVVCHMNGEMEFVVKDQGKVIYTANVLDDAIEKYNNIGN